MPTFDCISTICPQDQYGFVYRAVTAALMTGDTSVDGDAIRNIDLANMGTVTMGNRTVEEHLQVNIIV